MAQSKTARVVTTRDLGSARLIEFAPAEPLDFVGGQYLIINSGLTLPDGKLAKRAYSIASPDCEQARFTLFVRRIGEGLASNWLHLRAVGDEIPFSGPWGKFLPDDRTPRRATWIVATDTAITAALGLVNGAPFAPQIDHASLHWLVESDHYFLPPVEVAARLPRGLRTFSRSTIPWVGHPERLGAASAHLADCLRTEVPVSVFLAGDGAVIYPLRQQLIAAGVLDSNIRLEPFFNNPAKKSQ